MSSRLAPLRLGVIGVGRMGSRHLRALLRRDDVVVCAVADPSPGARSLAINEAMQLRHVQPSAHDDAASMLDGGGLDAVVIATPPRLHLVHCLKAFAAGMPVLVEKPMASTIEDGRDLLREAELAGVLLMVGLIERFNPAVVAMRELLRTLPIGKPILIETWRHGVLPDPPQEDGVALDLAIHDVDLIRHLLGDEPSEVAARQVFEAGVQVRLEARMDFRSGITARLCVQWTRGEQQRRVVVHCQDGLVEADLLHQDLRYHVSGDETSAVLMCPGESLVAEHDAFIHAVRTGGPSPVSGDDGLRALAVVEALVGSADRAR